MERVSPGHCIQGRGIPQTFRILPGPAVRISIRVAAGAGNPPPPHHRLQCGVEQNLAQQLLVPQRILANLDIGNLLQGLGVVTGHCEIQRIVDVKSRSIGGELDGSRIMPQLHRAAVSQFAVVIIHHIADIHIIGPGEDGADRFGIGRNGCFPWIGDHEDAGEGIHRHRHATSAFTGTGRQHANKRHDRTFTAIHMRTRANVRQIGLGACRVDRNLT